MFPEPTELLLIGYLTESIWTPKSKMNILTPKTNSQTCEPREISHVTSGIIFLWLYNISRFRELSLGSRSFLHRVNDQVRKRQKQSSKDATKDSDKHSVIWRMFMSSTLQASVFMRKNHSDNWHSIKNSKDLTMKQMFDISEKLKTEQSDEMYEVNTINWEYSSWKCLSLVSDEQVISLQRTKVYVFSDSVLCLGEIHENPRSNTAWEERSAWFKSSPEYRNMDRIDGEPNEFEWNIFQDSPHCSSATKFHSYC